MSKLKEYEWLIEERDLDGEILDVDHADKFPGFPKHHQEIGVVLDEHRNVYMVRSWAYIKNGKLPSHFKDAFGGQTCKVPKRFHDEVKNFENKENYANRK